MAYTTPPNFIPSSILTSAQLNILSDNQQYFYGLITGVNAGFPSARIKEKDTDQTVWSHLFYKTAPHLVWRIDWHGGEFSQTLVIHVEHWTGGSWVSAYTYQIFGDGNPGGTPPYTAPYSWTGPSFFLEDAGYQPGGIPNGDFFRVWVRATNRTDLDFEMVYFFNLGAANF